MNAANTRPCGATSNDRGTGAPLTCAMLRHGKDVPHVADGLAWFDEQPPIAFGQERQPTPMRLARIERLRDLLDVVLAGLRATPFKWGDGQREHFVPMLAGAGVELVTKTAIEKRGHVLKRGAKPVGTAYFGAPLKRYAPLYVLHVQTKKKGARA